ncbi:MAG: UDP-N-acetylglucosamine 1-carboxyvinyltransferase [Bacilli bacterium]
MKQIKIEGNKTLTGQINIGGSKNSAVALVPASILCDETAIIDNIPNISDIEALNDILEFLGSKVKRDSKRMEIDSSSIENKEIPESISKRLRASYYFMSALLGKYKHVEMYFPGGCSIGARPIDQTLKGFKALGATVQEIDNKFIIDAKELIGSNVYLDMPSVGATINTILVAVKAKGKTIIENAAKEPEIVNVTTYLNNMGANIKGAGTSKIVIEGVTKLHKTYIEVIPDRIEAGTYVIAGALLGDNLKITNIIPDHIQNLLFKLEEMGVKMEIGEDFINISHCKTLNSVNIKTLGYPGFPTDLQQPIVTLLTQCNGESILEETIYENRFQNIPFLNEMGANIVVKDKKALITGPSSLKGKVVKATDLRAGACLILAGLRAEGTTIVTDIEHVLRGYENIIEKLSNVGAKIQIEEV